MLRSAGVALVPLVSLRRHLVFLSMTLRPPSSTLFPYTTLFRSLVSVRSGAAVSMPGMMETILNLGLNDETVQGLIAGSKRSEEHTSELQSRGHLVCRLLREKKNKKGDAQVQHERADSSDCPRPT